MIIAALAWSLMGAGGGTANTRMYLCDGRKTVAVAGTAEALGTTRVLFSVSITALDSNAGTVVVGGENVVAAAGTRRGRPLTPGETMSIGAYVDHPWLRIDPSTIYLDVTAAGDGVSWVGLTAD